MSVTVASLVYLVSAVCFIMALRGLSHPQTAKRGLNFGIAGMVLTIITTMSLPGVLSLNAIILGILIGGTIGTVIAKKIEMTALPQLVAAFHSLVGLAAVFVAAAAFYSPEAYG
ncbi:MAG: NAD(P)(+) transhydrogenase (Re/Si-specific) subunit beta, partial [Pseudomonadota bacterium]